MSVTVNVGDPMPSVGLRASDGYVLNLRSFVTKQPAAFLFFGAPTSAGAARRRGMQAVEALRDGYDRLDQAGAAVVGVSCDSPEQQAEFIAKAKLPFLLFSDERRTAVEMLGIDTVAKGENVNVAQPMAFAVDRDGFVKAIYSRIFPEVIVDQLIRALSGPMPVSRPADARETPSKPAA